MPNGPLNPAPVDDFAYAIGGLGDPEPAVQLDNFDPGPDVNVVEFVQLPFLEQALKGPLNINQPLGRNDCCRGSVSNSLRYLQATRQIKAKLPTDLDDVNDLVGKPLPDNRTRSDWAEKKQKREKQVLKVGRRGATATTPIKNHQIGTDKFGFTDEEIDKLIKAIKDGNDVEMEIKRGKDGHVMMVVAIRKYADGSIGLGVFDDSQADGRTGKADPIKWYRMIRAKRKNSTATSVFVNKTEVTQFVIEAPTKAKKPRNPLRRRGRSRGNSVDYNAGAEILAFAGDVIVDTEFPGDPLVGAEVVMPPFRLVDADPATNEFFFDRAVLQPVALAFGPDVHMIGDVFGMTYDGADNRFHATLFNIRLAGVDPASELYDPHLAPINSPFLQDLAVVLDPDSPDHDPEPELYFTFEPDIDFLTATSDFTLDAASPGDNFIFLAQELPEPTIAPMLLVLTMLGAKGRPAVRRRVARVGSNPRKEYPQISQISQIWRFRPRDRSDNSAP